METAVALDEIAAGEQSVGQLLNRAFRRIQGGCQLGQAHAARAQGHGLEDLDHSVDRAMRAGRHAADASKPYRRFRTGTCTEARVTVQSRCDPDIRFNIRKYVHEGLTHDRSSLSGDDPHRYRCPAAVGALPQEG